MPIGRPRLPGKVRHAFAGQLASIMARRGLSRSQVVERLGVSQHTVTAWLEGKRKPANLKLALEALERS